MPFLPVNDSLRMSKSTHTLSACILLSLLLACHSKPTQQPEEPNMQARGDTVVVSAASTVRLKLKTYTIREEQHRQQLTSAATVQAIPNQYADIAPPFDGRILRSFVQLGQSVAAGSPLFELSSPDFTNAQKAYFQARQQHQLADLSFKRQQDLMTNGVGTQRELEESRTNAAIQQKEYENTLASLRLFRADAAKLILGQPLVVRSPIAGQVIRNSIVVGQYLTDNATPVATVAELSKVWVAGQVKEKDIRFVHQNDEVSVQVTAYPGETITGRVFHLSETVDEETKAIQALVICSNQNRKLKPGMYATIRFIESAQPAILIPANALLQKEEKSYVFLQTAPDRYVRRSLETGDTDKGRILVKSGLKAGDVIVSTGAFYLLQAEQ